MRTGVERAVGRCMVERWTYRSRQVDREQVRSDLLAEATGSDAADAALRARQRYGITAFLSVPADAQEGSGPAADYYRSLGTDRVGDYDAEVSACQERANEQVLGDVPAWAAHDRLLTTGGGSTAAVEAGQEAWTACMADAGYVATPFTDGRDADLVTARIDLEQRARDLYEASGGVVDPAAARVLQAEEIALARQDWACWTDHVPAPWTERRDAAERALLAQDPDLFARIRGSLQRAAA